MTQKNETKVLVLSLLVTAALLGAGFWWFTNHSGANPDSSVNSKNEKSASPESGKLQERVSLGDKIL